MELLRFNVPVEAVRDWAAKRPDGLVGFEVAVKLLAQEVRA
jgi:hypothetical protein